MGLDMYLDVNRAIYKNLSPKDALLTEKINQVIKLPFNVPDAEIRGVSYNVAYWRKCNQIHRWFIDNVQGGKDDCQRYNVDLEHLHGLLDTCKEVLADRSKAKDLLPTQEGFFFGATGYDDYYFGDLELTVKQLEPLVIEHDEKYDWDFYYRSSW